MNTADKRLFLIDAYAIIFRAFYSLGFERNSEGVNVPRALINSKGFNTTAVRGFTDFLNQVLTKEKPTHLAVVFDHKSQTIRAQEHAFYKAQRDETPEGIKLAEPYIRQIIDAFGIPILEKEGYEADDVIGTIAKQKEKEGFQVFMVTPDKDFAQLVSENIFMYKPSRQGKGIEIIGVPEVQEKWEVQDPMQVIDILGMWGDSVDNIPGIPGVGEKTAKKFINAYGSMEGLYENLDQLKGKMKEKVEANKEQAFVSKYLATIVLDVPISVADEDLLISNPNKAVLQELFTELEFKTLGQRILGDTFQVNLPSKPKGGQMDLFGITTSEPESQVAQGKNAENTEHNYKLINTPDEIGSLIAELLQQKAVAFDTETTGLNALQVDIVGMSFCWEAHTAYYVPCVGEREEVVKLLQLFEPFFLHEKIEKIGQNIKYDIHILMNYNIAVKGPIFDTMMAHYLLEPDQRHNMDFLSETYLGYSPISIETLIGKKGKNQKLFSDIEVDKQAEYAAEDADVTWQLAETFKDLMAEQDVKELLDEVELPLIPVLASCEREGIRIDSEFLGAYSKDLTEELISIRENIFKHAEYEFNLDSPKQVGEALFDRMKIPYKGKKTKTGQYSTDEDTLTKLKKDHEIIEYILEYRQITKLKSTYIDALPNLINPNTGRIHTTFSQAVASTGRLSSNNPNLQNIPIRTERGRKVRKAFVPKNDDYVLLAADYSQIELRLIAELSGDKNMMEAFVNGQDIHTATAAKVFGVTMEEVTREMRSNAKTVNFGIIYGVSAFGLSQQTNLSRTESKEIIESYFATYPGIRAYMEENKNLARKNGYVTTILGRKRWLRTINSSNAIVRGQAERNAINAPVQGSAADMIKVAMINIQEEMVKKNMESKMLLQVHDELVFDAKKTELEDLKVLVKEKMEGAIPNLTVPILAEMGTGSNWLEAH